VSDDPTNPEPSPAHPSDEPVTDWARRERDELEQAVRDIGEVPAVEVITTVALHLMSAAAVKCGLGEEGDAATDLDEARKLVNALAGLVVTSAPDLGTFHAAPLRDGLTALQRAFREASAFPDPPGDGPGERLTGPVA
jgi:hypothetical protein